MSYVMIIVMSAFLVSCASTRATMHPQPSKSQELAFESMSLRG
jgi:hypothetical protein